MGAESMSIINTYLRKKITKDKSLHGVNVGDYTADVKIGNVIYEIMPGHTKAFLNKLEYLVENNFKVVVVMPIIRTQRTEFYNNEYELVASRHLRKLGTFYDKFKDIYWLDKYIRNGQISIKLELVDLLKTKVKTKYNTSYGHDEQIVTGIKSELALNNKEDYKYFIKDLPKKFDYNDFVANSKSGSNNLEDGIRQLLSLGLIVKDGEVFYKNEE